MALESIAEPVGPGAASGRLSQLAELLRHHLDALAALSAELTCALDEEASSVRRIAAIQQSLASCQEMEQEISQERGRG